MTKAKTMKTPKWVWWLLPTGGILLLCLLFVAFGLFSVAEGVWFVAMVMLGFVVTFRFHSYSFNQRMLGYVAVLMPAFAASLVIEPMVATHDDFAWTVAATYAIAAMMGMALSRGDDDDTVE